MESGNNGIHHVGVTVTKASLSICHPGASKEIIAYKLWRRAIYVDSVFVLNEVGKDVYSGFTRQ